MVTITESAQDYLAELLSKQDDALGVRVFINQPGTSAGGNLYRLLPGGRPAGGG